MALEEADSSTSKTMESDASSSRRLSFSKDFLEETKLVSSCIQKAQGTERERGKQRPTAAEFEFLSGKVGSDAAMLTADELFFEGKLLPFWQIQHSEKLNAISLRPRKIAEVAVQVRKEEESRVSSWFLDDDPSPRPPKCTVLWKELLRLRKQSPSSPLYPPSSSNSSAETEAEEHREGGSGNREKSARRVQKGVGGTRSAPTRIRPIISAPICAQTKSHALPPPLFPLYTQEKKIKEMKVKASKRRC